MSPSTGHEPARGRVAAYLAGRQAAGPPPTNVGQVPQSSVTVSAAVPLPTDVPAGGRVAFPLWLRHPPRRGDYRLSVSLTRGDGEAAGPRWERSVIVD